MNMKANEPPFEGPLSRRDLTNMLIANLVSHFDEAENTVAQLGMVDMRSAALLTSMVAQAVAREIISRHCFSLTAGQEKYIARLNFQVDEQVARMFAETLKMMEEEKRDEE